MMLIVTVLYTAVEVVAVGTLPDLARSGAPLEDAAGRCVRSSGGFLMMEWTHFLVQFCPRMSGRNRLLKGSVS